MTDLATRILAAIAPATSRTPVVASAVRVQLGVTEREFHRAVDLLLVDKRIASASRYRPQLDSEPALVIWPTGKDPVPPGRLDGQRLAGLFAPHKPMSIAIRAAHAPRVRVA